MAVTMAEISKLRQMTGAGMMDCKKALTEAENDMDKAIEILRKKGQAVAAKREDRNAAEGCVLAQSVGEYAAVVALNCETDFVAKNAGFVGLTKSILAAAVEAKAKSLDDVKALEINGQKIADLIVEESGKTGEKMELGAFEYVEAPATIAYNHFGNKLATLVAFNKAGVAEQVYKNVAMQVAAMNPLAVDECNVSDEVKEKEIAYVYDVKAMIQAGIIGFCFVRRAGMFATFEQRLNPISLSLSKSSPTTLFASSDTIRVAL